jgi:hypothetical protein
MHPKLRQAAIDAVAEYMGVAAFAGKDEYQQMYFFVCLGKLLPPEVPYAKVKDAILKATGIKA